MKHPTGPTPPTKQPAAAGPPDFVPVSANPQQHASQHRTHKKMLLAIIAVLVILLAVGGTAAYWLIAKHKAPQKPIASSNTQQTATVPPPTNTSATSSLVQYTSNGNDLNLTFSYPSNWTVTPPSNSNTNDKPITLTSAMMSMADAKGNAVTGKVVISINPGGTSLPELAADKATSSAASVQFAYTKPTPAQHQYPYLTYVHLNGGGNPSGLFEEVIITGITAFAKDQAILPESVTQIDPLITARFYQCSTQDCATADATSLSITASEWQNTDAFSQVQAVFASMQMH